MNDGGRSDKWYGGGERFVAGEDRKVQLGIGAGGRKWDGVEDSGGVEVTFAVGGLEGMGLRWAQLGFAGGHIGKFSWGSDWRWDDVEKN